MIISRGDIVWLKSDVSANLGKNIQSFNRPYVVISNNTNNKYCPTINIVPVTKKVDKIKYPMHVFLDKNIYELEHDSVILTEQIITINKYKISKKCKKLNNEDLKKLDKAIYIQFIDEEFSDSNAMGWYL